MQKLITKYGLAAHLAVLAVAPLFLFPEAVLWISAYVAVWVVMEPSRIGGEMLHDARRRVARAMFRDPLMWAMLFVIAYSVVRYLNGGVALAYDAENRIWSVASPGFPILPGVVDGCGFPEVGAACALLVLLQGVRHAIGRSARGAFSLLTSFFLGAGALLRFVSSVREGVFAYDGLGIACGIGLVLSVVALSAVFEHGWYKSLLLLLVGIAGNAIGLFTFAQPHIAMVFAAAALLTFVYAFVYVRLRLGNPTEFKLMVLFAIPLALAYAIVTTFMPAAEVQQRIVLYVTGQILPEQMLAVRACLSEVSLKIWETHPWIGMGLGSYAMDLGFFAEPSLWETVSPTQADPMNGYWMLLVERGTVGCFVFASIFGLLCHTYFKRLIVGVRAAYPTCAAFSGLLVAVVALCAMAVDCTVLRSGIIVIVAVAFSLSSSSFPREINGNG